MSSFATKLLPRHSFIWLFAIIAGILWYQPAFAAELTVDDSAACVAPNYCTIQAATAAANPGDVIKVKPDNYNGLVTISDASVTIVKNGAGVANLNGAFHLTASNVTIDGFTIFGLVVPAWSPGAVGINVDGGTSGHIIQNNTIAGPGIAAGRIGIQVGINANNISILNNTIEDWNAGIYLNPSNGHVIENNIIKDNFAGIGSDGITNVTIRYNNFNLNTEGIGASSAAAQLANVQVHYNNFVNNTDAIKQYSGTNAIDARGNWYGAVSGPGATVSGNAVACPWLTAVQGTGQFTNTIGLGMAISPQDAIPYCSIQKAVSISLPGQTVTVTAGIFKENVLITQTLTLDGAGAGSNSAQHTIIDGTGLNGIGVQLANGVSNITIQDIRIQNFTGTDGTGIRGVTNNNLLIQDTDVYTNGQTGVPGGGIFLGGPINNVTIDQVRAVFNKSRGIVIWDGFKQNITITNNYVANNNCCGIELQDGTATGVTVTGNVIENNADSGMAFIGLKGPGANLISNNHLLNNGRFGIEVKLPEGNGAESGGGSVVVSSNFVTQTIVPADLRDLAGIAVYRRGWVPGNSDIPNGVVVKNNTVTGYTQSNGASNSDGFCIVVEGTNMKVLTNTATSCDVGIQIQAGHNNYVANGSGDGTQDDLNNPYFGRGNSPTASGVIHYNNVNDNLVAGIRNVGAAGSVDARANWYGQANGPASVGPGTGSNVSAGLMFCPWLNNVADIGQPTNTATFGLAYSPNDALPYCSIQKAVDISSAGQTVTATVGLFKENVLINKSLTLDGAGAGTNNALDTIIDGTGLNGSGIALTSGIANVTIRDLTSQNFKISDGSAGIRGSDNNNNLTIQNVDVYTNGISNFSAGGIYLNGPVNGVKIDNVRATGNLGRGIVIWNGFKQNLTITNNYVANNNCCGIELQDGTASGITVTGNLIENNGDSGMSFIGLKGPHANLISNNIVRNNGRFGIEIKLPEGNGNDSGPGSIVVSSNTVTRTTVPGAELRDLAGIAVIRRGIVGANTNGNGNIPTGVVVKNNTVSGFTQLANGPSNSDGFCIVTEGNNMKVLSNTVTSCDVGIQMQAGHTPYNANASGDGDQTNLNDQYFGRGNSPAASGVIYYNNVDGNLVAGIRNVGVAGSVDARANWWGDGSGPSTVAFGSGDPVSLNVTYCPWLDAAPGAGQLTRGMAGLVSTTNDPMPYCTIQAAINASVDGNTVSATPGTYNESPDVNKSVTLKSTDGYTVTNIVLQSGPPYLGALTIQGGATGVVVLEGFTIVGFDALDDVDDLASTNILITTDPNDVTVKNNRIRVGLIGDASNNDDGFGLLTTYSTSTDVAKLTVTDNIFEPLNTSGTRAFYINAGVNEFIFADNEIRGAFLRRSVTQAKDGTIENNLVIGAGAPGSRSAGLAAFGDPDPDIYGHTTFSGNIITGTTDGIAIFAAENVVIENNSLTGNDNGVKIYDSSPLVFEISTINIENNNIAGNTVAGVANTTSGVVDASNNWWGDETGPSTVGYGAGDPVTTNVNYCPWLDDVVGIGVSTALVTTTSNANEYCTIQAAIDASVDGAVISAKPSTYNESPNINKSVTLQSTGGFSVTNIVLQTGPTYLGSLTIDDVEVVLDGFNIVGRDAVGSGLASTNIYVTSQADDVTIKNNHILIGQVGVGSNGDDGFGLVTEYNEVVDIATLVVNNNSFTPVNSSAARAFYINPGVDEFNFTNNDIFGNFTGTSITQAKDGLVEDNRVTGAGAPGSRSRGLATWGNPDPTVYGHTVFHNNVISNTATGIIIYEAEDVVVEQNTLSNNDVAVMVSVVDSLPFDISTIDIHYNDLVDNTRGVVNNVAGNVDARVNWWGSASGPAEVGTGPTDDVSPNVTFCPWLDNVVGLGIATKGGGGLVTTTDDPIPYCTIQEAVNASSNGAVVTAESGTYTENVTINKTLTLTSTNGREQTTIVGISGAGALGTVQVTNNTNGLVISGFTIEGIDNNAPGIENAAVYFQGPHSNAKIVNNEINANGDLALLTEYGMVISGFVIDNNIFGGQTFTGTPAGQGSSLQFSLPNVPRQLVVISGGAGGGNTSNITFTNNLIQGIAGGINASAQEQGNTLVTIDSNGATITGNTFAGTTTYGSYSLRSRGPNSVIEDNTFSSTGMGKSTGHIFTQNNATPLATILANNEFDKGSYVALANGSIFTGIGQGIASATAGQTVIALPGLYIENVAYNQAVSLQGAGSGSADLCGVGDPDTQTIIRGSTGNLIQLTASGPSSANKLVIKDVRLELQSVGPTQYGISVGTSVSNVKLERVRIIGNAAATSAAQRGLVVNSSASVTDWDIVDSSFNCLFVGVWFAKETVGSAAAQADQILVTGSDFRNNSIKGMYVEKLSNSTISNNEFINNSQAYDKVSLGAAHSAGLDINLKFGTYSNITIVGNTFTGNGIGAGEGAALLVKARDDGSYVASPPTTLNSVTITNNVIIGNERGIRLGEPLKANNSPTSVAINHNLILTNTKAITTSGSTYGGVVDWTASPTIAVNRNAIFNNTTWNIAETNGGTVNGTCNWYNTAAGPSNTVTNTVTASPWLTTSNLDGSCVLGSIQVKLAVVGSLSYAPASWAITSTLGNFTLPQAGGTQNFPSLSAGTFVFTQAVDSDYDVVVDCGSGAQSTNIATINLDMAENASCTFTNTLKPATLTVNKVVVNDHGGTATIATFSLYVSGSPVTSGQTNSYVPGTYFVTENDVDNYSALISGDCASNGSITLAPGMSYTCTITNDDLVQGSINLSKIVVGGGSFAPVGGWQFYLKATTPSDDQQFAIPVNGGGKLLTNLTPGTYIISEAVDSDYTTTLNCGDGTVAGSLKQVTVGLGEVVSCTFTNTVKPATLLVNKVVVNDNGGTRVANSFPLFANGVPISNAVAISVTPGSYIISENAGTYAGSFSGDCAPAGIVNLAPGESKTCTVTNNDPQQGTLNLSKVVVGSSAFAPAGGWKFYLDNMLVTIPAAGGSQQVINIPAGSYTISEVVDSDYSTSFNCGAGVTQGSLSNISFTLGQTVSCVFTNTAKSATLTVNKVVINDNGGTATAGSFPLFVDGTPVSNGVAISVTPGIHIVTENAGSYSGSFSGDCGSNGTVNVIPGDNKTCTITNNDPGQGTLNLTKVVVGGSSFAPAGGWQFYLGSTSIVLPVAGGSQQLTNVPVGSYTISEVVDSNYATSFNCGAGVTQGSSTTVNFGLGQTINCTFTNTVKSATLMVNKVVINDNGGTATPGSFPLFVDGTPVSNGVAISVTPGIHIVTENAGSYSGSFSGDCGSNGTVNVIPGDNKTCTVTNNDPSQGTLNLTKVVVGGSSQAPAGGWQFYLGNTPIVIPVAGGSNQQTNVPVGSYIISEVVDSNYSTSFNCGSGVTQGSSTTINFGLGQTINCTFTNTVKSATLTVNKIVVNDNGGSATADSFPLFANGVPVSNGVAISVTPGLYTISENAGTYSGSFSGDCGSNGTLTLLAGQNKSCTITNNDPAQGTLNLSKVVIGSSSFAPAGGWQFYLGSTPVVIPAVGGSQQLTNVPVGSYTISEVVDSDYTTTFNCGAGASTGSSTTINFALGQTINCVFTNTVKSATLVVNKTVINDNGGTATADSFPLFVDGTPVSNGVAISVTPGIHIVTENAGTYSGSFGGDCSINGTVNLVPGDVKSCAITNNDPGQGTLNLTKVVVGSNSFAPAGGWQFQLNATPIVLPAAGGSTQLTNVAVGSYTISEAVDSEYTTTLNCGAGVVNSNSTTINFSLGQTVSCVFTNTVKSALLTVNKVVVNDNGGTAVVADFPLFVNGNAVTSGVSNTLTPGTYVVTENAGSYSGTFSGDCSANGTVTLVPGDNKICTVTNNDPSQGTLNLTKVVVGSSAFAPAGGWAFTLDDINITLPAAGGNQLTTDIEPGSYTFTEASAENYTTVINCGAGEVSGNSTEITFALGQTVSCVVTNTVENATLTVTKVVVNDDGGTAVVSDFDLFVNGSSVTSGEANTFTPGSYTVSEDNFGGYSATFSGDCAANGTVSLAPGDVKSCTITNNDPGQGTVSLTKLVVGSSAFAPIGGWQFTLNDTEISIPAAGGTQIVTNLQPGAYTLSEEADADYTTTINCGEGETAGTSIEIDVPLGEIVNCTFTNTLRDASLTVTKVVINDDGGTAVVADFPLSVNGASVTSGVTNTFAPGTYTVAENNLGNYAPTFSGDCSANGVVTLAPGESKSCTITNNDIAEEDNVAAISLVKTVGVIEGICATDTDITVLEGETVYYCYTVTNNGNVTLTEHTLLDSELGILADAIDFDLAPGETITSIALGIEAEDTILVETTNTATWTAVATEEQLTATANAEASVSFGVEDYRITINGTYTAPAGGGTTGGQMRYDINVLNTGETIIKGMLVSFIVPPGTVFRTGDDAWSCADGSPAGTTCQILVSNLKPGQDVDFVLNLDIVTEIILDQLELGLIVETDGTTTTTTEPETTVVFGPDAEQRNYIRLPQLDRAELD